jgi:hypothetical protein
MSRSDWVHIDFDSIRRETDAALLFIIDEVLGLIDD